MSKSKKKNPFCIIDHLPGTKLRARKNLRRAAKTAEEIDNPPDKRQFRVERWRERFDVKEYPQFLRK